MDGCYFASDGRLMDYEDLASWLIYEINNNPNRKLWSFDDFTGGSENFINDDFYLTAKIWFENFKKHST